MKRIEGVYVATVTPFDKSGKVDIPAYQKFAKHLVDSGVHGLVPCGTTGETPTLSAEERQQVIRTAVEVCNEKGLPTIAGCGGNSTSTVVELVREAKELGATAALVSTPYYNKPTPKGVLAHYQTICKEGGLPVLLYNVPGRTSLNLSAELIAQLFEIDGIIGIKEASGNHSQWVEIAYRVDLSTKALLSGDDDCLATILGLGGTGIISASANVAPGPYVEIYNAFKSGDWKRGFEIQTKLFPLVKAMFAESNPGPAKYALSVKGWMENSLRLPLVPVLEGTEKQIKSALDGLK